MAFKEDVFRFSPRHIDCYADSQTRDSAVNGFVVCCVGVYTRLREEQCGFHKEKWSVVFLVCCALILDTSSWSFNKFVKIKST